MCLYPFAGMNVFSTKSMCFAIWARVDTKFLNLSHHVLSMDGWLGDATFSCGANLWRSCKYSAKKGPAHWILFLTLAPRPLQVTFFGWWSWTYAVVAYCKDRCMFSKKNMCFANWARVDTRFLNLSHHVLFVDGWPGDAAFSCGANLWRSSACIQPKKGPAPWVLFLTLAPGPLQVTAFGWWS